MSSKSVWRVHWSRLVWLVLVGVGAVIGIGFYLSSDKPWWSGVIAAGVFLFMFYIGAVQRNLEWVGYTACPACRGSGRVPEKKVSA